LLNAYKRAAEIYSANGTKHVLNERIIENWIADTQDFWFELDTVDDAGDIKPRYMRYHHGDKTAAPLFDHEALAKAIAPWFAEAKATDLGMTLHAVTGEPHVMYLSIQDTVGEFCYGLDDGQLTALRFPIHGKGEVVSPNKSHSAFVRNFNIFVRDNQTGVETQLTHNGRSDWAYGLRFLMVSEKLLKKTPNQIPPALKWSPDSKRILTYRRDSRRVDALHLVQSMPLDGSPRPIGASYPYSLPADEHILTAQAYVLDIEAKTARAVTLDGGALELFQLAMFESDSDQLQWTADGTEACLVRYDRYFKEGQVIIMDALAATARVAARQHYKTFGFTEYYGNAAQEAFADPGLRYLPESRELIWLLERDNWASLYLIDADTGETKKDLTPGDYGPRRMRHYDRAARTLYFSASAKEPGVDPYYQMLYSVHLDTGHIEKLAGPVAEHISRFQRDGAYYVDTWSTIRTVPITEVFTCDGTSLCRIATADISRIEAKGYIVPEPFEAVARDGVTPIYGILIKPHGFNPTKKYPVIDFIYGGSQRINTPKAFEFNRPFLESDPQGGLQSLAQLGFVGIIVDGLATPLRGKRIHDYIYGKHEEACGIEDHVCAIRQLAEQHSWIDADRVGIWGASGGGYATARALLQFPEFYKVGVSLCGNHDQTKYHAHWGERWIGPYSEEAYAAQANRNLAGNLEGHLLLIHGDMDDNVHPSATIQLAGALIEANKDFDMLIYPNSAHGVGQFPYVVRRRWDYFVRHLLGETPPKNFTVREVKKDT